MLWVDLFLKLKGAVAFGHIRKDLINRWLLLTQQSPTVICFHSEDGLGWILSNLSPFSILTIHHVLKYSSVTKC